MSDRKPGDPGSGQAGAMLPTWQCVLVVIAHPDDESFGMGAVIDQLTAADATVYILCYTRGGASTLNQMHADLHRVSRERQRRAALLHASQISPGALLWRRLRLLGDREYLRWLVPPAAAAITAPDTR